MLKMRCLEQPKAPTLELLLLHQCTLCEQYVRPIFEISGEWSPLERVNYPLIFMVCPACATPLSEITQAFYEKCMLWVTEQSQGER